MDGEIMSEFYGYLSVHWKSVAAFLHLFKYSHDYRYYAKNNAYKYISWSGLHLLKSAVSTIYATYSSVLIT